MTYTSESSFRPHPMLRVLLLAGTALVAAMLVTGLAACAQADPDAEGLGGASASPTVDAGTGSPGEGDTQGDAGGSGTTSGQPGGDGTAGGGSDEIGGGNNGGGSNGGGNDGGGNDGGGNNGQPDNEPPYIRDLSPAAYFYEDEGQQLLGADMHGHAFDPDGPDDQQRVASVTIDWGDGTTTTAYLEGHGAFRDYHDYPQSLAGQQVTVRVTAEGHAGQTATKTVTLALPTS